MYHFLQYFRDIREQGDRSVISESVPGFRLIHRNDLGKIHWQCLFC